MAPLVRLVKGEEHLQGFSVRSDCIRKASSPAQHLLASLFVLASVEVWRLREDLVVCRGNKAAKRKTLVRAEHMLGVKLFIGLLTCLNT